MTNDTPSAAADASGATVAGDHAANQTASFSDFPLPERLLKTLKDAELTVPTPIQQMSIPYALEGRDLVGLAQTGTGKTAAFLVPILAGLPDEERLPQGRLPKALILSPTRELATQIATNFIKLSAHTNLRQVTVCGGMRYDNQIRALRKGVDVVIATPGRLEDLMERGAFNPDDIDYFVMDEADHMLDLGFYPPMKRIFASLPEQCQTMLFSATMPPEIAKLAEEFLNDPHHIKAPQTGMTVDKIKQEVTFLSDAGKRARLEQILRQGDGEQALIFVRTKRRADALAAMLEDADLDVDVLHGDLRQAIRLKVLRKFREGKIQAVIATDVAARGIDVSGLSLVINYDLTDTPEAYIHRVGRTGRAGQSGLALSFCAPDERRKLAAIIEKVGDVIKLFEADGSVVEEFSIGRRGSGGRSRPPAHVRKRGGGRDRTSRDSSIRRPKSNFEPRPEFSKYDPADDAGGYSGNDGEAKPNRKGGRPTRGERGPKKFGDRGNAQRGNRFGDKPERRKRQRDDGDFEYSKRSSETRPSREMRDGADDRQKRNDRPSRNDRPGRNEWPSKKRKAAWSDDQSDRRTRQDSSSFDDNPRRGPKGGDRNRFGKKPFGKTFGDDFEDRPQKRSDKHRDSREDGFDRRSDKKDTRRNAHNESGGAKSRKTDRFKKEYVAEKPYRDTPSRGKPSQGPSSAKPKRKPTGKPSRGASARKSGAKPSGKQGGFSGLKRR